MSVFIRVLISVTLEGEKHYNSKGIDYYPGLPTKHTIPGIFMLISREAQSGRRLLGTNGGSLWLSCCLPQPGALGP